MVAMTRGPWPTTALKGLWPGAVTQRGLLPVIGLRGLWLGALRGPWPVQPMKTRGLWPMTTLRGLWPVVLVKTQATQPKTHRLDRFFRYQAGLLAAPGREW